jgi:pyruvate,water dikinase
MRSLIADQQAHARARERRSGTRATTSSALPWLALLLLACGDAAEVRPDAPYRTELESEADLAALSLPEEPLKVKYLAQVDGRERVEPLSEPCYFQDMQRYSWHLQFLQSFPEHRALTFDGYHKLVIRSATRQLWGGTIQGFPEALHPDTGERSVLAYVVYAETGGLTVEGVAELDARLKACMPFAKERLVFVPELPDQAAFLTSEREALSARGVSSLFAADLRDD